MHMYANGACICDRSGSEDRLHGCSHVKSRKRQEIMCLYVRVSISLDGGPHTELWCPLLRMMVKVYRYSGF